MTRGPSLAKRTLMNTDTLRILDANFNRAREALRVIEDYARFTLNDDALTAETKTLRHELTAGVREHLPDRELLRARDTPGDVGTAFTTASEQRRGSAREAVAAAAKRLAEALRVLEEYGKTVSPAFAAGIETLRYRSYTLEARVLLRGARHARMRDARLYVLITEKLCHGNWLETTRQTTDAGADCIQLREKDLPDGELLRRAQAVAAICRETNTLFFVNDRPDIARLADADGVHLGPDDLPVAAARRIVGQELLIGLSTHAPAQVDDALRQAPDYVAVGPMFESTTKPQQHIAGPELLRYATERTELPLVCIGGINETNAAQLLGIGRPCLAVCSAIIAHPDPAAAVRRLKPA
jgi:thiamine-phosphate pyrophosphorylase